ncbi:MAG: hypothetical protein ACI307_04025 [Sodaliphilus sp.]
MPTKTPPQKIYSDYSIYSVYKIYLNHNRPSEAHFYGRVILQAALRLHNKPSPVAAIQYRILDSKYNENNLLTL